jgi:hypothetical protein
MAPPTAMDEYMFDLLGEVPILRSRAHPSLLPGNLTHC